MPHVDHFAARPGAPALCHLLERVGLAHWRPVLAQWLPRFDGWRSVYLQDETLIEDAVPAEQVCALLTRYVLERLRPDDGRFAQDLARLDVLTWRARHDSGARWNSLEESFAAFAQRGEVCVWQFDTEYPEPPQVQRWLLGRLSLQRGDEA